MEAVVLRLEKVAERLERFETLGAPRGGVGAATPAGSASGGASTPAPAAGGAASALAEYDQLLGTYLQPLLDLTTALGPEVAGATQHLQKAFMGMRRVIEVSAKSKRPSDSDLQQLLSPVAEQMMAAGQLTEGKRTAAFNHLKVLAESLNALSWLAYSGPQCGMSPPRQHVAESTQSAQFFGNKILMEFRGKDEQQVAWVKALKDLMTQLEGYVLRNFPTGLKWDPAGLDVAQALKGAPTAAAGGARPSPAAGFAAPGGAGRPPPPPPPGPPPKPPSKEELLAAGGGAGGAGAGDMSGLFKELQKGEGITSGLKRVTDDMKSKNRADRSGVVSSTAAAPPTRAAPGNAAPTGTPKLELEADRKWVVEHQVGQRQVLVEPSDPKQIVYIYGCKDSVIQVTGKVNAISLDKCSKTGVVFSDVIASVEAVNCNSIQLQCTGRVPTVAVEKTDGCQIYLPQKVADDPNFQIVTAKCSALNVTVISGREDEDPVEQPVPEQFISTFRAGKLVTHAAAHSGA